MEKIIANEQLRLLARSARTAGRFASKGRRLSCAFHYLLKTLDVPVNEFLPVITANGKFPDTPLKRNHIFEVFAGHRPFRKKTMQALADRINIFLAHALASSQQLGTLSALQTALRRFSFVRMSASSAAVMAYDLFRVYEGRLNPYTAPNSMPEHLGENVRIEVIIQGAEPPRNLSEQELRQWFISLVQKGSFRFGKSEGSLKITLAVAREQATDL